MVQTTGPYQFYSKFDTPSLPSLPDISPNFLSKHLLDVCCGLLLWWNVKRI